MALSVAQASGIGAGISGLTGIGGIISGLIGSKRNLQAVRETNEMNYRIAQMNNEYNNRQFERQLDYNTEMWQKQTDYDSAAAQRKRLEEAGLNPYLMMSGGSSGSAASALSVNPPTAQPVTMQAPQNQLAQVGQMMMTMSNPVQAFANIRQALSDAKVSDLTIGSRVANADLQNEALRASTSLTIAQKLRTDIDIDWLPQQYSLMCSDYAAGIQLKLAQGVLTRNQAQHEIHKIAETVARIAGINKDNKIKDLTIALEDAVLDYRINQVKYESDYWRNNHGYNPSGWSGFFSGLATNPDIQDSFKKTITNFADAVASAWRDAMSGNSDGKKKKVIDAIREYFQMEKRVQDKFAPPKRKPGQSNSSYSLDVQNNFPRMR